MKADLTNVPLTLRILIEQCPEWADLPIVVQSNSGEYDWVNASGTVYTSTEMETVDGQEREVEVLVFAPN